MGRIITTKIFINESKNIHNNKYDYSLVKYIKSKLKVKIICPIHGIFEQSPSHHLKGQGCKFCNGGCKKSKQDFIIESNIVHYNKYDYSLIDYINSKIKVKIICPIHGEFKQKPNDHLQGHGCLMCSGKKKKVTSDFIKDANKIHNNEYIYNKTNYINNSTNVIVTCHKHGDFLITPNNHLSKKSKCPTCNESKGEKEIRIFLDKNSIKYNTQKKFIGCKYKRLLPFDFYLLKHNICIEFDGEQHFKSIKIFGGEERYNEQKIKDKIKTDFCKINDIKLIRIKYNENIFSIMNKLF